MPNRRLTFAVLVAALVLTPALDAYLKFGTAVGNLVVALQWAQFPVQYSVTNRNVANVTAAQLQTAVANGFSTWGAPEFVDVSGQFLGFTNAEPVDTDQLTVIGFQSRPDLDRVLGQTSWVIDDNTGEIVASDIFLNSIFQWSVAPNGEANRFDVESVLVHELGHLLGLGHSSLGETVLDNGSRAVQGKRAVMFPIAYGRASIVDRKLQADDVAGITDIYGNAGASTALGAIQGRVTLNNAGVYGAHVTAFNPATGEMVSGYTLTPNGSFVIAGLKPGQYIVRVEPLDDVDQDSVFDPEDVINVNFQVAYYSQPVSVPAGGAGAPIVIAVKSK